MLPAVKVKGRQLMDALADLKEPARLTEIAKHLSNDPDIEQRKLLRTIKTALDAGVRYGYIEKKNNLYSIDPKCIPGDSDSDADSVDSSGSHMVTVANAANDTETDECYGNSRGMRRRGAGEKRRSNRSRSRSVRKSSKRRRR